jgi:hypothetical protein
LEIRGLEGRPSPHHTHRKFQEIPTLSNDFPKNPKLSKRKPIQKNPQKKIPKFEPFQPIYNKQKGIPQ